MSSFAVSLTNQYRCTGNRPVYFSPQVIKDEDNLKTFQLKQEENFVPDEFFNEEKFISDINILPKTCTNTNTGHIFPKDWIVEVLDNPKRYEFYKGELIKHGLTQEEATQAINCAVDKAKLTANWSRDNEKYGREAATFAMFTGVLGIVSAALENSEFASGSDYLTYLKTISNVAHGFTSGQRGRFQYGYIYNRDDDDKGIRIYQKEKYGNNISGNLGNLSCTYETYLKPFALPVLGFISSQSVRESLSELLSLPTNLFWRSIYPGYINQRFLTHLTSYLANKPLALLGHKASFTALEKLEEDTNILSIYYVGKRIKSLLELQSGEKALPKILKLIKGLSSSDINVVEESSAILNEAMAPILGISGFFISLFGIPLNAISSLILSDESRGLFKRSIDSFSAISTSTQQLLYTLRFSLRELIKSKQIKDFADSLQGGGSDGDNDQKKSELYNLANNRFLLSYTGLVSNILGIFMPLIHLMNSSSPLFRATRSIFCETSSSLNQYFFSKRRELRGRYFRIENSALLEKLNSLEKQNIDPLPQEPIKLKVFKE